MIAIIDYGVGNLQSVENSLKRVNASYQITDNRDVILQSDRVILPGVGEASFAMRELEAKGLDQVIREVKKPLLGICLGMQLLCAHSEEGNCRTLGIIPSQVKRLQKDAFNKVPNIGWSEISNLKSGLFKGIQEEAFVYFVHSFAVHVDQHTLATAEHSSPFAAAIGRDNFYGCQFHPEKSGDIGDQIISNFIQL